jgi:hypothetical protein
VTYAKSHASRHLKYKKTKDKYIAYSIQYKQAGRINNKYKIQVHTLADPGGTPGASSAASSPCSSSTPTTSLMIAVILCADEGQNGARLRPVRVNDSVATSFASRVLVVFLDFARNEMSWAPLIRTFGLLGANELPMC